MERCIIWFMMIWHFLAICAFTVFAALNQSTSDASHAGNRPTHPQSSRPSATRDPQSATKVLFDGHSLDAWRGYKGSAVPQGWRVENGVMTKDGSVDDLVSKDEFADFELELEWKIGEEGNSGVLYRGTEEYDHIYWSAPEYQLLDDSKAADNKTRLTCAGAAYALYPSPSGHLKPVGEFNSTRIVARGPHVEHWLNNFKLLEYELWSPDWEAKVKASKFAAYPNFGRAKRGHISLQGDHAGMLAFRNIRIRELK
jgi:Domain of Unknown Function (DUF1080)